MLSKHRGDVGYTDTNNMIPSAINPELTSRGNAMQNSPANMGRISAS